MTTIQSAAAAPTAAAPTADAPTADAPNTARLRGTAAQLESIFVRQLFSAMRETVPHDGALDGGAGEEMFTSLLDEKIADDAPAQWHRSIADEVVAQLRSRIAPTPTEIPR